MFTQRVVLQTPEKPGEILRALQGAASVSSFDHITVAVAYITGKACTFLVEAFQSRIPGWNQVQKKWLTSIDFGLTEPNALSFLSKLPNSEVRVANGEEVLQLGLRPRVPFHPKLYMLANTDEQGPMAIISTSANLSVSGLTLNDEQAIVSVYTPPLNDKEYSGICTFREVEALVSRRFASARIVDKAFLEEYRGMRKPQRKPKRVSELLKRVDPRTPEIPRTKALAIALAGSFWVEVGYVVENRGPGRPGNQIDLQRGSRVFFGFGAGKLPRNTTLGAVLIRFQDQIVECRMRFGNNYMDKLGLPIPGVHGPVSYESTTLRFDRRPGDIYDLSVASDKEVTDWKKLSRQQGTLFRMRSGREYGVLV